MQSFRPNRIELRTGRKLMSTTFGNEIATAVNAQPIPFPFGEPHGAFEFLFYGAVVSMGPNGEDNFTDERYWVHRQYAESGDTEDPIALDDDDTDEDMSIICVTNWEDYNAGGAPGAGSHTLQVGDVIPVWCFSDIGDPGSPASGTNAAMLPTPPNVHYVTSVFRLPPAQYENEFLMSRADHSWGASLPRISESNELP